MNYELKNDGFSLVEILLAVGTLGIGMLFIAGTFLAGIHFSTIATEQTTAAIVADEAFAKVRLYATGNTTDLRDDIDISKLTVYELRDVNDALTIKIESEEFAYPSTDTDVSLKQYYWSALCRLVSDNPDSRLVQVTIFISRKVSSTALYPNGKARPVPMKVGISAAADNNLITITETDKKTWINDSYKIVDDSTGRIYQVVERTAEQPDVIRLNQPWQGSTTGSVWVIPPPVNGGKNPTIAIYQKVMRF